MANPIFLVLWLIGKSSKEYEDIHIIRDTWMSREQISDFNPFGSKKSHTWNKDKDFKRHNLSY